MVNSMKRPESRMAFGSNLVKPSELFGSVKRTINRNKQHQSRCQCKHHQQKFLAKQEEQRQLLQEQLRLRGDRRKIQSAAAANSANHTTSITTTAGLPLPHNSILRRKSNFHFFFFSKFSRAALYSRSTEI